MLTSRKIFLIVSQTCLGILLFKSITGDNIMEYLKTCSFPNPIIVIGFIIFIRNIYAVSCTNRKKIFPHAWNLGVFSAYGILVQLTKNGDDCDAACTTSNLLMACFFLIVSSINPIEEIIHDDKNCKRRKDSSCDDSVSIKPMPNYFDSSENYPTEILLSVNRCNKISSSKLEQLDSMQSASALLKLKSARRILCFDSKTTLDSSKKSTDILTTNSIEMESVPTCIYALKPVEVRDEATEIFGATSNDQQTQTFQQNFSKCCQFPNCNSDHLFDKKIDVETKKHINEHSKIASQNVLPTEDRGDFVKEKNEKSDRSLILSSLLSQLRTNMSHQVSPLINRKHRAGVLKKHENDVVKIEDLIYKRSEFNFFDETGKTRIQRRQEATYEVPQTPKEIPVAVARALESITASSLRTEGNNLELRCATSTIFRGDSINEDVRLIL